MASWAVFSSPLGAWAETATTFERTGPDGVRYSAEQMHRLALASLHEEFAQVQSARDVLARFHASGADAKPNHLT